VNIWGIDIAVSKVQKTVGSGSVFSVRKLLLALLVFVLMGSGAAQAHQPVDLLKTDTTAAKGPLLVDGTISFAIRASFTKAGEKKGFRAQLQEGDALNFQYLIMDKKPENALKMTQLPTLVVTGPGGFKTTMKLNERTKFLETFSQTMYLYLGRHSSVAKSGVYSFLLTSRGKASITLGVGDKEIPGEVLRGPAPTPTASAKASASASASATTAGFTMAQVKANNSAKSCWAVVDDYVYDLTKWINSHPGGPGAIVSLCGTDATTSFKAQHQNQAKPAVRLDSYKLGPLQK
jgi:hypothetical protein